MLVLFVTIIGGRVIPSFTANAVPGFSAKRWRFIEAAVIPATLLAFGLDALGAPWAAIVAASAAAAAVHGLRLGGWRSWRVGNRPILAILHIAYAGIPLGFVMLALAALGAASHSVAIHMFTTGVIGTAIIAMITRTARGHTGRALVAGRVELACYGLFILATLMRVLGPWLAPQFSMDWIYASGLCWAAALVLYCIRYAAWLLLARADGKPG
jgi:uncharacterized protein involved in response to NO